MANICLAPVSRLPPPDSLGGQNSVPLLLGFPIRGQVGDTAAGKISKNLKMVPTVIKHWRVIRPGCGLTERASECVGAFPI